MLDKEKFRQILRTEGLAAAITALHKEKERLEFETFEGTDGYRPDLFKLVQEYCEFSRELWDRAADEPTPRLPDIAAS